MPRQTKIFRVFVSSTFTDMKEERSLLQKYVFPKLEKFCQQNNAKFQAVDLRWGINEESQLSQKTLQICLNEVARCQRISPKPNFLILLGDKYGWQPIPEKILTQADIDSLVLEKWYLKDENAIPAQYLLQPRKERYEKYDVWEKEENNIKATLRNAVDKLNFSKEQRIKYFTSATHQEILNGIINPPVDIADPRKHVFAFIRETTNLPTDKSAEGFIDLDGERQDIYAKSQLDSLKKELENILVKDDHFIQYDASWDDGKPIIDRTCRLLGQVYYQLKTVLKEQLELAVDSDEIAREQQIHEDLKNQLVEHFRGRKETLNFIHNYIEDISQRKILSLIGISGSGKTSVLARLIHDMNESSQNEHSIIPYRFLGTTTSSSNVISMMQSMAGQIAQKFDKELIDMVGQGKEKDLNEIH